MLCQVTVTNYKCFKNPITLDMQATNLTENNDSVIVDIDGEKFLPVSVIYGPNGSGKSTVLSAIYSLACKIMRPICAVSCDNKECLKNKDGFLIVPFKFSEETLNAPTSYQFFFRTTQYEYEFNISIYRDEVIDESLYRKKLTGKKYTTLFLRNKAKIQLFGSFKDYVCDGISSNLSLISYFAITHKRNNCVKDIVDWFEHSFNYVDFGNPLFDARIKITKSERLKELFLDMLQEMDIDISDYRVVKKDGSLEVFTKHNVNGTSYELDLAEESSGTIKLFSVLSHVINAISAGATLMIDELDAKLHPLLLNYIINLFNDPKINKFKSQLIFTSHDLTTMNSDNFRRDEVWFVAKGVDQSSYLYSLVEIKNADGTSIRKDARYSKSYLEGKYGADPYFKKIINWEEFR